MFLNFLQKIIQRRKKASINPEMSSSKNTEQNKVAEYWGKSLSVSEKKLVAWMGHPGIQRHINMRITGDPSLDWFTYVNQKYIPVPVERGLSLGCGEGGLERHAFFLEKVKHFDAIDISQGAVETARREAERLGILDKVNYITADLNRLKLPLGRYDIVFASMSIHHIEPLESLFGQIHAALREGGYFICNEYIGPTRFQLPEERIRLINDLLSHLPERLRKLIRNGAATSDIKTSHQNPPLSWFIENDPSEAIRSGDIVPALCTCFDIVEEKPYGGGILHFLLQDIIGNFGDENKEDNAWINMLGYFEKYLEDHDIISSDFSLIVAKSKPS